MATTDTDASTAVRKDFERNGFVVVRQFLPATDFRELTDNLDRYRSERNLGGMSEDTLKENGLKVFTIHF